MRSLTMTTSLANDFFVIIAIHRHKIYGRMDTCFLPKVAVASNYFASKFIDKRTKLKARFWAKPNR